MLEWGGRGGRKKALPQRLSGTIKLPSVKLNSHWQGRWNNRSHLNHENKEISLKDKTKQTNQKQEDKVLSRTLTIRINWKKKKSQVNDPFLSINACLRVPAGPAGELHKWVSVLRKQRSGRRCWEQGIHLHLVLAGYFFSSLEPNLSISYGPWKLLSREFLSNCHLIDKGGNAWEIRQTYLY